jgi:predicted transcriptional regulator
MNDPRMMERLDALTVQIHEWTESTLSLDEGHFPSELLNDLEDLIDELKGLLEDGAGSIERQQITEIFVTPEMAEVIERFPKVRRLIQRAFGSELTELIEEEATGFGTLDDDDE